MNYYEAPTQYGYQSDGGEFSWDVFQGNQPACGIYAQYNILKDYGYIGTAEELIQEAIEYGWYDPNSGTPGKYVGKLLELHGVACDVFINANKYNLLCELAHGKRIIVTVDSGELWSGGKANSLWERIEDTFKPQADHALVVSGLDTSDSTCPKVILTDSGAGQLAVSYPLEQFEDAWADGHCTMIVTREPPPKELELPSMANFDYELGHIDDISYQEWVRNLENDQCRFYHVDPESLDEKAESMSYDNNIASFSFNDVNNDKSSDAAQEELVFKDTEVNDGELSLDDFV